MALMTPEQVQALRVQTEMDERNRPLTDEDLDAMFPQDGYKILDPPSTCVFVHSLVCRDRRHTNLYGPLGCIRYVPVTPMRRLLATPTPMSGMAGFSMQEEVLDKSKSVHAVGGCFAPFLF
jgi:splicing factor 3B subunit 1